MKVSLKKAAELQKLALDLAGKIDVPVEASVSFYTKGEPTDFVMAAHSTTLKAFHDSLFNIHALNEAGYEIRKMLGAVNASKQENFDSSINDLLVQRASVEAQEKRIAGIISMIAHHDTAEETIGRIEAQKAVGGSETTRHGFFDRAFAFGVVGDAELDTMKKLLASLRQQKSELRDQLAVMNINLKIELSDSVVETLRKNMLIA
jgi:hypothetical protein